MLAAEIWYWWIGVALLLLGIVLAVVLVGGYLKTVSAQRYPDGKRSRQSDL